jgi:hypothetical protein
MSQLSGKPGVVNYQVEVFLKYGVQVPFMLHGDGLRKLLKDWEASKDKNKAYGFSLSSGEGIAIHIDLLDVAYIKTTELGEFDADGDYVARRIPDASDNS